MAALRAATAKDRSGERNPEDFREHLARVVSRSGDQDDTPKPEGYARERLKEIMEKDAGRDGQAVVHKLDGHSDPELGEGIGREARKPSVNERLKDVLNKPREKLEIEDERLKDVLNKPREKLEIEDERDQKDQEVENDCEIDRDIDRDSGLSH